MVKEGDLRAAIFREYKNVAAFCEAAGVSRGTMDNIIQNRCEPSQDTIQKICNALHELTAEEKFYIFFT